MRHHYTTNQVTERIPEKLHQNIHQNISSALIYALNNDYDFFAHWLHKAII